MSVPENVVMAMRFAQALWPHDPAPGSEATGIAWAHSLAPYPVEELYPALEELARTHAKMPALAALLEVLRARQRKATPLLAPPVEAAPTSRQQFLRESQRRADDYREQLIRERTRIEGSPTPERLAEIRAWAYEVGPLEAAWLQRQGVEVEVTQPQRPGGNAVATVAIPEPEPEPTPPGLDEIAEDFARRWVAADATGKEFLRDEAGSFAEDTKLAVNEAVRRLREVPA